MIGELPSEEIAKLKEMGFTVGWNILIMYDGTGAFGFVVPTDQSSAASDYPYPGKYLVDYKLSANDIRSGKAVTFDSLIAAAVHCKLLVATS